ncbi:hypothetical protein [Roseburia sp. 499]|uniref:hypothetical protein n=1 Tax=Roseburia sp. 499 TaxID=1261634 RepID=UPI000951F3AE|nr:hypothetical protein [Roseburia sp. 499]WVK70313.1 hypothetical protein BIV20_01945 [Roseburia sp. 499]
MEEKQGKNTWIVIILLIALVFATPTLLEYARRMKVENEWGGRKILMYDGVGVEKIRINELDKDECLGNVYTEEQMIELSRAFMGGASKQDMEVAWGSENYDVYYEQIFTVSEQRERTVNIEEVERILSKDSEKITNEEYDVLALAYLLAEKDDLDTFFLSMLKERTDHNESWYASSMYYKVYSEWEIDHEKVEQIGGRVAGYEKGLLRLIWEYRAEGDEDTIEDTIIECDIQREHVLQRMTLLDVVNQMGTFDGEYKAENPILAIEETENRALLLRLCEGEAVSGIKPTGSTLRQSTVTISQTEFGIFVDSWQMNYSEYVLNGYLGSNTSKKYKKSKNLELIEKQYHDMEMAMLYSDYDCCVNYVDYNLAVNSTHMFYPYEGEQTESKIRRMNNSNKNDQAEDYGREELAELLRKEFPTNGLSVEIVLTRPDDVIKFMRGLSGRSEDIYFDIIGNKIKE